MAARILTVLILALATPCAAQQRPLATSDPLDRVNQAIDALTRKVWPSVVQLLVTSYGAAEDDARGEASAVVGRQRSIGSGFVIDADGYIMTNAHVVNGAQRIQVVLPPTGADGSLATALTSRMTVIAARVVGITTELDLALLKVDGLSLPALPLASYTQVRQGQSV